jgi:hypothetical protein
MDESLEPLLGQLVCTDTMWNFGVKLESRRYATPKLYLGKIELKSSHPCIAIHDCRQYGSDTNRPILGILGMDFLRHYCIQLDFAKNKMRFLENEGGDEKSLGKPFPLVHFGDECPFIRESLVGPEEQASAIDTGCNYDGWLTPRLYQHWTNSAASSAGFGVRSPNGVLGGEKYPDLDLLWLNPQMAFDKGRSWEYNGIGLNLLARHLVTFDFPNQTMYLKRTSIGPIVDKELEAKATSAANSAVRVLKSMRKNGQLPGWSKGDEATSKQIPFNFLYPDSGIFDLRKRGDPFVYHYDFVQEAKTQKWKLRKAWRSDQNDEKIEEYPVP